MFFYKTSQLWEKKLNEEPSKKGFYYNRVYEAKDLQKHRENRQHSYLQDWEEYRENVAMKHHGHINGTDHGAYES